MTLNYTTGISILILVVAVEILGVWLLPRMGIVDPLGGLLAAALGGAIVGGLVVWTLLSGRPRH